MEEEKKEAKEVEIEERKSIAASTQEEASDKMDELLDDYEKGKETPTATSTEEKTTETETKPEEVGNEEPDLAKKGTETSEETKESEGETPEEFHKHPAWIRKQKQVDDKDAEIEELQTKLSTKEQVDVDKVTSSSAYIRAKMEDAGYKEETILLALEKAGHTQPVKQQDIVDTVIAKLGYKKENLTQEQQDYIHDIAKVSNIIADQGRDPEMVGRLERIETALLGYSRKTGAEAIMETITKTVSDEGILDFKVDIEPKLHKFLDDNPDSKQEEILGYFKDLNHELVIGRGTLARKKEDRDVKKSVMKQNTHSVGKAGVTVPEKTGNASADADSFLDAMGVLT